MDCLVFWDQVMCVKWCTDFGRVRHRLCVNTTKNFTLQTANAHESSTNTLTNVCAPRDGMIEYERNVTYSIDDETNVLEFISYITLQSFFNLAALTLYQADVLLLISFIICFWTTYVAFGLFGFHEEEYTRQVHSFDKFVFIIKSCTLCFK